MTLAHAHTPIPPVDPDMTRRFLSAIIDPQSCVEFRVFHAQFGRGGRIESAQRFSSTLSGWYNDPNALAVDARRLDGVSAYVIPNPADPALLARADNKLILSKRGCGTNDENIASLRWLYIDIDAKRLPDISSNAAELATTIKRRDGILGDFPDLASSSLWGCSGNGTWILVRLPDYPNDERHRAKVAATLAGLSSLYSDNAATVDVATKNPSRLMCLPGTVKCKGSHRPDRPWRLVTLDTPIGEGLTQGTTRDGGRSIEAA